MIFLDRNGDTLQVHGKDSRGKHLKKNKLRDAKKKGLKVVRNKIVK